MSRYRLSERINFTSRYNPLTFNQLFRRIFIAVNRLLDGHLFDSPDTTKTADFTVQKDIKFYPVDCTSGDVTVTLLAAADTKGMRFTFKKIDSSANKLIIDGSGAETIDDATTQELLAQYDSICTLSDGTENWIV